MLIEKINEIVDKAINILAFKKNINKFNDEYKKPGLLTEWDETYLDKMVFFED